MFASGDVLIITKTNVLFIYLFFFLAHRRLDHYVEHYEPLDYDADEVDLQHVRCKRSLDGQDLRFSFRAHGKHFKLRLRRDLSAFSDDFKVPLYVTYKTDRLLLRTTLRFLSRESYVR